MNEIDKLLRDIAAQNVSRITANQVANGVGPIPSDAADNLLLEVAQLPHDKLRGLIVIAATDMHHPIKGAGVDVKFISGGTPELTNALLELLVVTVQPELDKTKPGSGEKCPGCGEVHEGESDLEQLLRSTGHGAARGSSPDFLDLLLQAVAGPTRRTN